MNILLWVFLSEIFCSDHYSLTLVLDKIYIYTFKEGNSDKLFYFPSETFIYETTDAERKRTVTDEQHLNGRYEK